MKQLMIAAIAFASMRPCGGVLASAQSMDDLNLQVHGYATQGFVYSTNNNWDTTSSTDGSAAWTEAVVNLTVQPQSRLRVGVQARYFLLGNYGNSITLDWAQADYKANGGRGTEHCRGAACSVAAPRTRHIRHGKGQARLWG